MDDKNVVFSNSGTNQPAENNARLTLDDLYGPSQILAQKQQAQPPQSIGELPIGPGTSQNPATPGTPTPPPPGGSIPMPTDTPPPLPFWKKTKFKLIFGGIGLLVGLLIVLGLLSSFFSPGSIISGNATLTYWGLWEDSKTMQSIITDFERQHPNIHIQYSKQDNKKYKERLLTRVTNGTGPDIFTYHNTWLPTVLNITLPLPNSVITPQDVKKDYFPIVQKDLSANGALYGLPQGIDTLALFVNKDIFDAAGLQIPQTWEEFIKAAKSLTVKDENGKIKTSGAAIGAYDNVAHAPDLISLLFIQNGVDLKNLTTSKKNVVDTLRFYTAFATDNDNIWDETLNPSQLAFANNEVAMMFGYSWDIFLIKASNPQLQFEVYPVPNLPGKKATVASYWVNGVSNKSKYQKEALIFMKYLAQKEVQQKLYTESAKTRLFGTPYARIDLANTLSDNPLIYPFVQQASYAQSSYFASDTKDTNYSDRLNAYLGNAIRGVTAGSSIESSFDTLSQGVAQVRSQYGL